MQVVILCLNPAFGWSASLLSWMNEFSLLELLLPDSDPGALFKAYLLAFCVIPDRACLIRLALFNFVTCIVLVVVLGAIADAACT